MIPIYVHTHTHTHNYIHTHTCILTYVQSFILTYRYTCTYIYIYIHTFNIHKPTYIDTKLYVCNCVFKFVGVCVCMYFFSLNHAALHYVLLHAMLP